MRHLATSRLAAAGMHDQRREIVRARVLDVGNAAAGDARHRLSSARV